MRALRMTDPGILSQGFVLFGLLEPREFALFGPLEPGVCTIRASLELFGGIDTSWSFGCAVFGVCDASKWCQSRLVVSILPTAVNRRCDRSCATH